MRRKHFFYVYFGHGRKNREEEKKFTCLSPFLCPKKTKWILLLLFIPTLATVED